jgi:membrane associated rhomboid family serine protease
MGMSFWDTVTAKLLIANTIVFILTSVSGTVFNFLALTPVQAVNSGYVWEFFTYMYVHANFEHIFLNMFGLVMFGPTIEKRMGSGKYFLFYTLCGIGSAVLHMIIEGIGIIQLVGASGAIFGIFMAYAVFYPKNIIYLYFVPMPAWLAIGIIALMQVALGIYGGSSIAFWGHIGGMIVGFILVKYFKFGEQKPRVTYFWEVE